GIAHQLVEVDLGHGDEGACSKSAFDDSLVFQAGQGVASRHEAYLVGFGQFALGCNRSPRPEVRRSNMVADLALDSLVGRGPIAMISRHSRLLPESFGRRATARNPQCNQFQRLMLYSVLRD